MMLNKNEPAKKSALRITGRTLFRSMQVLDDAIWHGLNKPADKMGQKTHISKHTFATSVIATSFLVGDCISPPKSISDAAWYMECGTGGTILYEWGSRQSSQQTSDAPAIDGFGFVAQVIRLPMLLGGMALVLLSSDIGASCGVGLLGNGMANYLTSGSNGAGKKAKDFAKSKFESVKQLAKSVMGGAKEKLAGALPVPLPVPIPARVY